MLATQCLVLTRPKAMRVRLDGRPAPGVSAKDLALAVDRRADLRRRRRPHHRVRRRGRARAVDGSADDALQHEHRGRRAVEPGAARRRDLRATSRPPARAGRRGVGRRRRRLAHAGVATRTRPSTARSTSTPRRGAAGHLGHAARSGRADHRRACPIPRRRPSDGHARRPGAGARPTWGSRRARRSTPSTSTASSSARAPTRASRTCARPRASPAATASPVRCGRWWCPGSQQRQARGRSRGPRPGLQRRRLRMARAGLLDVPGHERRRAGSPASAAPRPATATSKAGRAAADARTWSARRWPRPPRFAATSPTCAAGTTADGAVPQAHRAGGAAGAARRRHRPDHPEAVPEAARPHRLRRRALLRLAVRRPGRRVRADFVLNQPRYSGRIDPRGGCQFRLRLVARARRLGAARLSDSAVVLAPSFADIFASNALANGLLAARLDEPTAGGLAGRVEATPGYTATVDLETAAGARRATGSRPASASTPRRAGGCSKASTTSR